MGRSKAWRHIFTSARVNVSTARSPLGWRVPRADRCLGHLDEHRTKTLFRPHLLMHGKASYYIRVDRKIWRALRLEQSLAFLLREAF